MAYVPDEAIRRRNEVSSGAFALYIHLCMFRCHKQDSENFGLAFPRQQTLIKEMGMNRQHISAMTTELVTSRWICKEGWKLRLLLGFDRSIEAERSPDHLQAFSPAYIDDRSQQNTTIESDNESYDIPKPIRASNSALFSQNCYQTRVSVPSNMSRLSDKSNCQISQTQLSGFLAKLSESSDAHDRNQQVTNKEPVEETHARENLPFADLPGENQSGDELTDPAVLYWWQACQQRRRDPTYPFKQRLPSALTIGMAARIAGRAADLDVWRETVDFWSGNDYQLHHVMTILDNYQERLLEKSKRQGASDVSRHDEAKRIREERRRTGSVDGHHRSRPEHLRTA